MCLGYFEKDGRKEAIWVPAELCDIVPGSARRGKLTPDETAQMIKMACKPPAINSRCLLEEGLPTLGFSPQRRAPILASFGIEIADKMTDIPARVLDAPRLAYRSGPVNVRNGAWNILDVKFQRGAEVKSYWVFYIHDSAVTRRGGAEQGQIQTLATRFRDKCEKSGIRMPRSLTALRRVNLDSVQQQDDAGRTMALRLIQDVVEEEKTKNGKPSFILVLLGGIDKYIYPGIKVNLLPLLLYCDANHLFLAHLRRYPGDPHPAHATSESPRGQKAGSILVQCRIESQHQARRNKSQSELPLMTQQCGIFSTFVSSTIRR